jgi:hypothetical protein
MQGIKFLEQTIRKQAAISGNLFSVNDLRPILYTLQAEAFRAVLWRAERSGMLQRVCRGLYLYDQVPFKRGMVLYKAVNKLRPLAFNYLSLESVLCDAGVISQMMLDRLTIMSSGRSSLVDCGVWGTLEFVHTRQKAAALAPQLRWDADGGLWRASPAKAWQDLQWARRNLDLVDKELLHEFV